MIKRAVHTFEFASGSRLFLRWHRYTDDGVQFPGGYTAEVHIYADQFEAQFPGSPAYSDCMSFLMARAVEIVERYEGHTWSELGITGIALTRVYAEIPRNWYSLQYSIDFPPSIEIRWQRTRGKAALPAHCDGVLLYAFGRDEQGNVFADINVNKGRVQDRSLQQTLLEMMQACLPIAELLDEHYGIKGG